MQQSGILGCHKAAAARLGHEEALGLEVLIGALGGNNADTQFFCQQADTGQSVPLMQLAGQDLLLDLPCDLRVDRLLSAVG